ncbi:putative E3 ubiquitin-protein ligase RING1b [Hirschfeldia incana]|nr:putative E3 ubiquitin-protein ligase RING1b [Hirschfeldia incana]
MPASNNVSAAEKEDEQLGRTPEAEEEEEDPDHMDVMEAKEGKDDEALEEEDGEERSQSPTSEDQSESEFIEGVELEDIRKYVQCPICLGVIRKTRTVMGCLHRFCKECIDKSMRFGNHECPACRKHCASRRSLRPDPKFDAFIAATFGNIDSNEEQDLAFDEDELARNKQIQASIAQVSQRQSEALVKRKSLDAGVLPRSQPSGSGSRRRRNRKNMEHDTSQAAHGDDDNRGKASSSSAETSAEIMPRKRKRRTATRSTAQPSSSCPNNIDNGANNVTEEVHHGDCRETLSHGLAWGRGGTRSSNARQGNNNNQGAGSSKSVRNARLNRLVEYLGTLESSSV